MTPTILMRWGRAAGAGLSLLLLSGCIQLLPESQPANIYRLGHEATPSPGSAEVGEVILIERPGAPRALAGNRIATVGSDGELAYISGANWISPAPDLLQELLLDTVDRELPGYSAARPGDGVSSRFTLRVDMRHFEAVYDEGQRRAPQARVALRARLVDSETHSMVGVTTVSGSARAGANRQTEIVEAFSGAARSAAAELAQWTRAHLSRLEDEAGPQG